MSIENLSSTVIIWFAINSVFTLLALCLDYSYSKLTKFQIKMTERLYGCLVYSWLLWSVLILYETK
ncbi:TMhelix containing protein [Vibrio phage 1.081.O._10N.286.52.C2]|nr:TMhelix containing protein [Vibrio phage 1.081.O._10N.286.52.C2]